MSLTRLGLTGLLTTAGALVLSSTAFATVSVSKAELSGAQLRVEGTAAANRSITVNGVSMTNSDAQGRFKLQNDSFSKPSDCKIAVNDGSASATTATLSGCTVSTSPSPSPSPTPTPTSNAALSKVTVSPTDVVGGDPSTGTVTLTGAAASGGFTVALSSDDPAAASVPASVTVPAGRTSATFPITTFVVPNPQSSLIIGTAGTVTTYGIVTAWTPFLFNNGSVGVMPGGGGSGTVTSQPAGINCTFANGNGSGTCSKYFPIGTVVRLDARPASNSSFVGFRPTPGCGDASKVTVFRGAFITCQVGFILR